MFRRSDVTINRWNGRTTKEVDSAEAVVEVDDRRQHDRRSRCTSLQEHRGSEVEVAVVCAE
jgi:hypothetical protein